MTDEQRKRIHDITYSTDSREELAERIVKLEDERDLYSGLVEVMDHPDTADQLREENDKLRKACAELLKMAESHDPEWLHWPETHEEMRKLGVEGTND